MSKCCAPQRGEGGVRRWEIVGMLCERCEANNSGSWEVNGRTRHLVYRRIKIKTCLVLQIFPNISSDQ